LPLALELAMVLIYTIHEEQLTLLNFKLLFQALLIDLVKKKKTNVKKGNMTLILVVVTFFYSCTLLTSCDLSIKGNALTSLQILCNKSSLIGFLNSSSAAYRTRRSL
jgi:hypothetical protein